MAASLNKVVARKQEVENKIQALNTYNSDSAGFLSEAETALSTLNAGLSTVRSNLVNFKGSFAIPQKSEMEWATKATENFTKRQGTYYYYELKKIMDEPAARALSEIFAAMPSKVVKTIYASEGFWVILADVEKKGLVGKKAVDYVINGLSKYEALGEMIKASKAGQVVTAGSKVWDALGKLSKPVSSGAKELLKSSKVYKTLSAAAQGDSALAKGLGFLGKGANMVGKAATVFTYANVGISGGVGEYFKSGDIGKSIIVGTFSAIKSVGPLEGATIGASIGGGPIGATIGLAAGTAIWILNKTGVIDKIQDGVTGAYAKAKANIKEAGRSIGKAVGNAKNAVSNALGGIGKAFGFG